MFELAQLWPQFLRPWALLLVLPALGLYGLSQWPGRRASAWAKLIKPEYLTQLSIEQPGNSWLNPARLSLVCSLVWVLALAGPSWRQQQTPLSESQQALVLVLQLNDSMLATDLAPSRLQQAKLKALALLREQPAAAVALVVFAGSSHTVLPLTKDQQTLEKYLLDLQPHIMPAPGYRPELALGQAQALLKAYAGGGGSIVFMADGEGSLVQSHSGEQKLQPIYWRFNAT
ncbi:MAG: VWA domain-containing protein, partial [Cellvibrionaceae bacterium]|nr:VWA domain-containing protein [Cellvibrionaceae bacterium]